MQKMNELESRLWESLDVFSLDGLVFINQCTKSPSKMNVVKAIKLLKDGI